MRVKTTVRDLQPGDRLIGSNRIVLAVRSRAHLSARKREVVLARENSDKAYAHEWWASTNMLVERIDLASELLK